MTGRLRWPAAVAGGIGLAAVVAILGVILLRPTSVASADGIAVECEGVGSADACASWAASVLADGPGIRTFDPDDLARLRLSRPFLLPGECGVEYFVGRDLDDAVATETVDCPSG